MAEFLKEFWSYLRARKKLWLLPTLIVILMLGGLVVLAETTPAAPFIYTLF